MTGIGPLELLGIDHLLSDDERDIQATVREFVDRRVRPNIADWYERGEVPVRELASEFGKLGLLGMHLTGYGCAGASAVAYGLACTELEAADSGVRSLVSVQGSLAMYAIWRYGSAEQKERWLRPLVEGDPRTDTRAAAAHLVGVLCAAASQGVTQPATASANTTPETASERCLPIE